MVRFQAGHCALLVVVFASLGCKDKGGDGDAGDGGDDGPPKGADMVRTVTASGVSDGDGIWALEVDVEEGETALMITAIGELTQSLESVFDPDGERVATWRDWYDDESLTQAFYPYYDEVVINWPVRAVDAQLRPGTWTFELASTTSSGNYSDDVEVEATVQLKKDPDLNASEITVRIVYADGLEGDGDIVSAVEAASERWREIWANYGITLVESYDVAPDVDEEQGWYLDSSELQDAAAQGNDTDLMLVVVEEIGGDSYTYGVAGGIPGSVLPIPNSTVLLSWLAHAGGNGQFSDGDISLMGETMAHEIGHYIGLFHIAEFDYDTYQPYAWDALEDTEECSTYYGCENALGENLMFAFPVCTSWTSCNPQGDMTDEQVGVSQRYLGAL
jgi:hypothetical protein